jgi:hypothetical protein
VWRGFSEKEEVRAKREADRVSYVWDEIINHVAGEALAGNLEFGEALTETEIILRTMAKIALRAGCPRRATLDSSSRRTESRRE